MDALIDIAKGIGIAGVFVAIMLLILANVQTQVQASAGVLSAADNATTETINAVADIPGWLAIIVVVGIAVVIFVLLGRMSNAGSGM